MYYWKRTLFSPSGLSTREWVIIIVGIVLVPFALFGGIFLGEITGYRVYGVLATPRMSIRMSQIHDQIEDMYDLVDEESISRPPIAVPIQEQPHDALSHSSSEISHQYSCFADAYHPIDSHIDENYTDAFRSAIDFECTCRSIRKCRRRIYRRSYFAK